MKIFLRIFIGVKSTVMLPPELCEIEPISVSLHEVSLFLPSILWRIETLLLSNELADEINSAMVLFY